MSRVGRGERGRTETSSFPKPTSCACLSLASLCASILLSCLSAFDHFSLRISRSSRSDFSWLSSTTQNIVVSREETVLSMPRPRRSYRARPSQLYSLISLVPFPRRRPEHCPLSFSLICVSCHWAALKLRPPFPSHFFDRSLGGHEITSSLAFRSFRGWKK
jgi:hypothetical protein